MRPEHSASLRPTESWNYVFRVLLSFVLSVLVLDLIWSRLSSEAELQSAEDYWQDAFLASLWHQIDSFSPDEYQQLAAEISNEIGLGVEISSLDQVYLDTAKDTEKAAATEPESTLMELNGETYLLATFPKRQLLIQVGPLSQDSGSWGSTAVTLGFYALLALLIWVWIRPIVQGLDQLSQATQRFARNYREPLPELNLRSPVKELASSIESMALDIRALIQTQIELTGGLSHEIRTPLARIKFALASARSKVGDQNQFDSIEQDIEELEELVEAMLDYSRLQQAEAVMQWQSMDAAKTLEALAEKYRWRTGATINLEYAEGEAIQADARLMPLAISNLLVNATRYAKDCIRLRFKSENGWQRICVADDGPGIPEDKRAQAVQPFKKNACPDSESDGFGLGLAIVNRIASLHGGRVELDESPLGGLQVSIIWPTQETD